MRPACVAAVLFVFVTSAASTAHAQVRGRLTSQAAAPTTATRPPLPSQFLLPVWTPWGIATLPESTQSGPPIAPGAPTGGVQLDVQPWSAEVYVDGTRAGRVEEFRGYYRHLDLPAGPHAIAIVATDYEPIIVGVMVTPGKTFTYRATLQR